MKKNTQEPKKLTGKQQAFIAAYLSNGFNATKAAIEAGYGKAGAHVEGCRMLRNPKIARVIAEAFRDKGIAPETVQILLSSVAFDADLSDFEPYLSGRKTLEQLRADGVDTRAVKSATTGPRGRRIELHDRLAALKELGRILGLVTSKHEITSKTTREPDLENMTREQLERLACMLEPQPQGLQYLSQEELEVWATDVYEEFCRRRAGHPAEPAPQGLALLEDSAMMARSKMRCQERIRSTAAWGQQSSPPHGPKQAPAELPKPGS